MNSLPLGESTKVLSFYLSSNNQLLLLLVFSIALLVSSFMLLFFFLIFDISFLLLTLGFALSIFSSSLKCKVRLFKIFLLYLSRHLFLETSLIELLALHHINFHFYQNFNFYFAFDFVVDSLVFSGMLFYLHIFFNFPDLFLKLFLVSYCYCYKRCFIWFHS